MTTIVARLFRCDQKASVAVWVAVALPFLIIALVTGVEVSGWWVNLARSQQTGDTASAAGALTYKSTLNALTAATQAAHVAELNGVTGSASPTWNNTTNTLTDGNITVVVTPGVNTAAGGTVKVSIAQTASGGVMAAVNPNNFTIRTTSTSKVAPPSGTSFASSSDGSGLGGQPCMLALNGDDTGVTSGTDITFSGHVTISTPGCIIRSNAGITFQGNVTVEAAGYYAGGTIITNGNAASVSGTLNPMSGQIADPYALSSAPDGPSGPTYTFNKKLQDELTAANAATPTTDLSCNNSGCTGPTGLVSCGSGGNKNVCTVRPGTYRNWSSTNGPTVTLTAGKYIFTGSISLNGGTFTGSAVTILMAAGSSNSASTVGGAVESLTAVTTANVGATGAIPGVVFASTTTGTVSFGGNATVPFSGLIYLPNGNLSFAGTPVDGSSGCAQVIAETITLSGDVKLASSCTSYGLPAFGSLAQSGQLALTLVK
jgi:hypothetical protein